MTDNRDEDEYLENRDMYRRTPLFTASSLGYQGVVDILLKYGADIDASDSENYTPLIEALTNEHYRTSILLIENEADINKKTVYDATAIYVATQNRMVEVVELLIGKGANLDVVGEQGTALHVAISGELSKTTSKICEMLINAGADVNSLSIDNGTPLDMAILYERGDIVKMLRNAGGKTRDELFMTTKRVY